MRIATIEGIGAAYRAKLGDAGVATTEDLLDRAGSRAGRQALEGQTGISSALILKWLNKADLMLIPGIGEEYSDLLEAAGVDSPAELAGRNAANLATTIQELDAARPNHARRLPTEAMISGWIDASRRLPKAVEH